jgi:nitrate reductase NapE component
MENAKKRQAGILYLGTIVFGMIAQIIRSNIFAFDNNANILEKIKSSIFILRLAFFSDLLMILFYLLTAWTLYNILRNVNKNQSLLFFIFTIISVSIMGINMINQIAIIEINTSEYFNINKNYDLKSLSQLFSKLHSCGYLIAQIFFGLWLLPLGDIIIKSKIMPKYFGIMLIAATFGHLLEIIVTFVFPKYNVIIYPGLIIAMVGEFSFCFWLLFKGIKIENK